MKIYLTLSFFLLAGSAFAQMPKKRDSVLVIRLDDRMKADLKPLYVIFSQGKIIAQTDTLAAGVEPRIIKSINVLKGKDAYEKYKEKGNNGAIEIYLNDEKYPEAYRIFKN